MATVRKKCLDWTRLGTMRRYVDKLHNDIAEDEKVTLPMEMVERFQSCQPLDHPG